MAKLAVFTCVLFLACITQVFTFPGLHLAIGKTQTDIESILSNVLASSEETPEDQSAVSSVSDVSKNDIVDVANSSVSDDSNASEDSEEDVVGATDSSVSDDSSASEDSEEEVVDATDSSVSDVSKNDIVDVADSPVSKDTGDVNNGKISSTMMKLITFFKDLFKFGSSDSSEENAVSDNSETQVVEDEESSEDSEVEVVVVKIEDLEESANPDFIVDSKVSYDEVAHASESSSSENSEPSEVLENLDETSN